MSYTYDSAGNVTNDGSHTYVYDAENRVASVDSGAYSYGYDHQNRRVKKAGAGATTHYLWQGSQVIAEYNGSTGAVQVQYYYAGSRMVAKQEAGQARKYFLSDRLSVRVVLDGMGNVIGRQGHLPFGEEIASAGEQDKHHFTSYEKDTETGLDYAINRGYSSAVARFQSSDPYRASGHVVDPQSWNRYSYVQNNPANFIDPLGLLMISPIITPVDCGLMPEACGGPRDPGGPIEPPGDGEGEISPDRPDRYDYCRGKVFEDAEKFGGLDIPSRRQTNLALAAGHNNGDMSAMVAAIWAKESRMEYRPTGDHGPAQLTGWWRRNHPELIEPGAYDPFDRRVNDQRTFTGSIRANIMSLGNIVRFLYQHHGGSFYQIPYNYGPGGGDNNPSVSQVYANDVMIYFEKYKEFFNCMTGQSQ